MKSDLVDLDVIIHHETDKALLVSTGKEQVWVPKSQAEFERDYRRGGRLVTGTLTLSERLAIDKGLV